MGSRLEVTTEEYVSRIAPGIQWLLMQFGNYKESAWIVQRNRKN